MIPRKFKYIIVDGVFPILFTDAITHADVAREYEPVTSAGFAEIYWSDRQELEVMAYGESISLKLKSNPIEDAATIKRMLCEPI